MPKEDTKRKQGMYAILRKWKKSSLSLRDYGEIQGITYGVMKYWHRKYKTEYPDSHKEISKKETTFIPVEVSAPVPISKAVPIEIHYPNSVFFTMPFRSM